MIINAAPPKERCPKVLRNQQAHCPSFFVQERRREAERNRCHDWVESRVRHCQPHQRSRLRHWSSGHMPGEEQRFLGTKKTVELHPNKYFTWSLKVWIQHDPTDGFTTKSWHVWASWCSMINFGDMEMVYVFLFGDSWATYISGKSQHHERLSDPWWTCEERDMVWLVVTSFSHVFFPHVFTIPYLSDVGPSFPPTFSYFGDQLSTNCWQKQSRHKVMTSYPRPCRKPSKKSRIAPKLWPCRRPFSGNSWHGRPHIAGETLRLNGVCWLRLFFGCSWGNRRFTSWFSMDFWVYSYGFPFVVTMVGVPAGLM